MKEKGRRVGNDNSVNECSIEVLTKGDNMRVKTGAQTGVKTGVDDG
jgi:hypothetical protein